MLALWNVDSMHSEYGDVGHDPMAPPVSLGHNTPSAEEVTELYARALVAGATSIGAPTPRGMGRHQRLRGGSRRFPLGLCAQHVLHHRRGRKRHRCLGVAAAAPSSSRAPALLKLSNLPIRRITKDGLYCAPRAPWPQTLPPVRQLLDEGLDFGPATILVGKTVRGSQHSLRPWRWARAVPEGGSTGAKHSTRVA